MGGRRACSWGSCGICSQLLNSGGKPACVCAGDSSSTPLPPALHLRCPILLRLQHRWCVTEPPCGVLGGFFFRSDAPLVPPILVQDRDTVWCVLGFFSHSDASRPAPPWPPFFFHWHSWRFPPSLSIMMPFFLLQFKTCYPSIKMSNIWDIFIPMLLRVLRFLKTALRVRSNG